MSDSNSIDLSELQGLAFGPTWAQGSTKKAAEPAKEIVWDFGDIKSRGFHGDGQDGDFRGRRDGGGRDFRGGGGGGGGRGQGGGGGFGGRNDGPRRSGPPGPRPAGGQGGGGGGFGGQRSSQGGPRQGGQQGGQGQGGQFRGPRPEGGDRGQQRGPNQRQGQGNRAGGGGFRDNDRRGGAGGERRPMDDRPQIPVGWYVKVLPEPRAVENLARQIKASGRAYAVFDVAKLFLSSRDRYLVHFHFKKPQPRQPQQQNQPKGKKGEENAAKAPEAQANTNTAPAPAVARVPEVKFTELVQCTLDGALFLTREEGLKHCRENGVLDKLYQAEVIEIEAPKGIFLAVGVCGFSGAVLGPPNHHSYQTAIARLHREKFANMPIDRYKSRITIQKDEAKVAEWLGNLSKETQYTPVKVAEGEEAPKLKSLAERDAHFMKNYADEVLISVKDATVSGGILQRQVSPGLWQILRMEMDRQTRFPIHLVQEVCRDLESHGLRFFKRDKRTTFVCRNRPHFIGNNIVLSDRVKSIVELVRSNPGIEYTKLVSVLAPAAKSLPPLAAQPEEAAAAGTEGEAATAAPSLPEIMLSTAEVSIMQDLKWLVQEGYITEFGNGELHILGREHYNTKEKVDAAAMVAEDAAAAAAPAPEAAEAQVEPSAEAQAEPEAPAAEPEASEAVVADVPAEEIASEPAAEESQANSAEASP